MVNCVFIDTRLIPFFKFLMISILCFFFVVINGYRCVWCRASAGKTDDTQASRVKRGSDSFESKIISFQGNLNEYREAAAAREDAQKIHRLQHQQCDLAASLLTAGLVTITPKGDEAGRPPTWANKVDDSHDAWQGAGLVVCKRCASVSTGVFNHSRLFDICRCRPPSTTNFFLSFRHKFLFMFLFCSVICVRIEH